MNRRSQTTQMNFFSPVWVRLCLDSSSERANRLSQDSHTHIKGFSPTRIKFNHDLWNMIVALGMGLFTEHTTHGYQYNNGLITKQTYQYVCEDEPSSGSF